MLENADYKASVQPMFCAYQAIIRGLVDTRQELLFQ
jgi:hypothetical protein